MPISKPQQNRLAANAPTSPDHYDWLTAAARRNFPTADAIPIIIEAVEQAEMDPEHAHLDDLMS
jgi:disulfide oxidoreductase YuzD